MRIEKLNPDALLRTAPEISGRAVTTRFGVVVIADAPHPPYLEAGDGVFIVDGKPYRVSKIPPFKTRQFLVRILRALDLSKAVPVKRGRRA